MFQEVQSRFLGQRSVEAVVCWVIVDGTGEFKGDMTVYPLIVLFWILGTWKSKIPSKSNPNLTVRQL